jgi:hypothetical protein
VETELDLYASIDIGTTCVKLHTGEKFSSGISENVYDMATKVMTLDKKKYMMELYTGKTNYDINSNKALNKNARLNYLYGLHKLTKGNIGIYKDVVVPLPAKQYENEESVAMYKKLLTLDNSVFVDVNGDTKEIFVDTLGIVPEDFPAYYTEEVNNERFNGKKVLLLGIGGFNSNQYLIHNDDVMLADSDEKGCLSVFSQVASIINSRYNSNIAYEEVYEVLTHGLQYKGKPIDIKPLAKESIMAYCKEMYNNLKLKFSVDTVPNVICVGGGSIVLSDYLREYIPHLELIKNAQNVAAKGMRYMLGIDELQDVVNV